MTSIPYWEKLKGLVRFQTMIIMPSTIVDTI